MSVEKRCRNAVPVRSGRKKALALKKEGYI
jgi:hypothetical protein